MGRLSTAPLNLQPRAVSDDTGARTKSVETEKGGLARRQVNAVLRRDNLRLRELALDAVNLGLQGGQGGVERRERLADVLPDLRGLVRLRDLAEKVGPFLPERVYLVLKLTLLQLAELVVDENALLVNLRAKHVGLL